MTAEDRLGQRQLLQDSSSARRSFVAGAMESRLGHRSRPQFEKVPVGSILDLDDSVWHLQGAQLAPKAGGPLLLGDLPGEGRSGLGREAGAGGGCDRKGDCGGMSAF